MTTRICEVPVCDRAARGRYCPGHAKRNRDGREMNTPIQMQHRHGVPYLERLLNNADTSGGPDSCWEWQGHTRTGGGLPYGRMSYVKDGRRTEYVHRISWEEHNGQRVPDDKEICHNCNNPKCVNPAHLRVDTRESNIRDEVKAGTHYSYFREWFANGGEGIPKKRLVG